MKKSSKTAQKGYPVTFKMDNFWGGGG